jgi:S-adenosyl methyltransferase
VTPVELNTDVPHSARIYDYLLGGKDNFAAVEPMPGPDDPDSVPEPA